LNFGSVWRVWVGKSARAASSIEFLIAK
jgi:hypothetical protein